MLWKDERMDILGKTALVTGGASGMGAQTARELADVGAEVVLLDRNFEAAVSLAQEIDGYAIECNVCDPISIEMAINEAVIKYGAIHAAINCAGIATAARMVGREGPMPLDSFNQVIQVNLVGTFNVMRCVAAQMIKQDPANEDGERGVIINTASVAAFEGQVGQVAYSASKGGIVSMTLPAARELSQFGIRVMTIAPGVISTPMMAGIPEKVEKGLEQAVPFPHRLGRAEEYSKLVLHIIENRYLNGSVIRLDGAVRLPPK